MLATGQSLVAVLQKLHLEQNQKEIHIAVVIATPEGIQYLEENVPSNCHLWVAALDDKLNEHNYIVPGLGDAGDLAMELNYNCITKKENSQHQKSINYNFF